MRKRIWQYLISYIISAIVVVGLAIYEVEVWERPFATMWSQILYDATFVVSALFILTWLLAVVSSNGFFDMFAYSFKKFGSRIFRKNPRYSDVPKTFYDYRKLKEDQEIPYTRYLLWVALSWIALVIVFAILYHCGIGHTDILN